MDLASYLLKPVQRMGKYALLLQQLMKASGEKETPDLSAAEAMVRFQLRHGNDLLAMDSLRDCDVSRFFRIQFPFPFFDILPLFAESDSWRMSEEIMISNNDSDHRAITSPYFFPFFFFHPLVDYLLFMHKALSMTMQKSWSSILFDLQVNLKEQGRLLRQNEFLVWQGKGKKCLRHVFLFEELILFSKARRFPDRKVSVASELLINDNKPLRSIKVHDFDTKAEHEAGCSRKDQKCAFMRFIPKHCRSTLAASKKLWNISQVLRNLNSNGVIMINRSRTRDQIYLNRGFVWEGNKFSVWCWTNALKIKR